MNTIILTDLFGFNIKNNSKKFNKDYIIIDIPNNLYNHCLSSIGQYNGNIIYSLNKKSNLLHTLFKKYNIDFNNYVSMGNYISHNQHTIKIIVADKKNIKITNNYNLITIVNDLYIWKPLSNSDSYTNLGIVCTRNDFKPDIETGLIVKENCNIFDIHNSLTELFVGDYSLINSVHDGKRKIITTNLLKNKVEHFINHYNENENEHENEINKQNQNESISDNEYTWDKYKGKQVVLVTDNNPWYVNKNITIPLKYVSNNNFLGYNVVKNNYAKYESNVTLDKDSPTMGYGYSYASRRNVEGFNNTSENEGDTDNNSDIIIFVLFFMLLLLFIYNIYYKRRDKKI